MFQVYENNKPCEARYHSMPVGRGWDNSCFTTFEGALNYLKDWLGDALCFMIPENLEVGQKVDYNGSGDIVEIREIADWDLSENLIYETPIPLSKITPGNVVIPLEGDLEKRRCTVAIDEDEEGNKTKVLVGFVTGAIRKADPSTKCVWVKGPYIISNGYPKK